MSTTAKTENVNKLTNLQYWFMQYKKDHMTEGNIKTHYIGVPGVTISLLGFLNELSFSAGATTITASMILFAFAMLWYVILDKKLAAIVLLPMLGIYYASTLISLKWHVGIHLVSWFFQLLGHYKYEGRSPAFFKSLPQLLIGPIFIFAKAINYEWNKR